MLAATRRLFSAKRHRRHTGTRDVSALRAARLRKIAFTSHEAAIRRGRRAKSLSPTGAAATAAVNEPQRLGVTPLECRHSAGAVDHTAQRSDQVQQGCMLSQAQHEQEAQQQSSRQQTQSGLFALCRVARVFGALNGS